MEASRVAAHADGKTVWLENNLTFEGDGSSD